MIRHRTARRIAAEWHGGQWTGLYALASSGAIIVNGDFSRIPSTHIANDGTRWLDDDPDTLATLDAERELTDARYWVVKNQCNIPPNNAKRDYDDLTKLLAYVRHYGPRGPVEGWERMKW